MQDKSKITLLLEESPSGTIRTAQVSEAGLHRSVLQNLVSEGEVYCYGRGIYVHKDAWEDDLYLLQCRYTRGIYSHETALYLHGYTDRTPARYTLTFPKGYNSAFLKEENVIIKRAIPENYALGITEMPSPSGNPIRVYDLEKTLCDILRGSSCDIQHITDAMRRYAASPTKDIHKLLQYAAQLRVQPKVRRYLEILL